MLAEPMHPDGALLPAPGTLRKCLVVGAGVAGLQAARQLLKTCQVLVLEATNDIGGVWAQNYVGYSLQVPWRMYQFPEFLWPKALQPRDEYPSGQDVQRYIRAYAQHFGLMQHVRLNCKLLCLRWHPGSRSWEALYADTAAEKFFKVTVDYVVICTGIYSTPFVPRYTGADLFAGTQLHAKDFTDISVVRGRRVLVVGAGKTALDCLCTLVASRTAASVTMLYRQAHWPVPRTVLGVSVRSLLFNRATPAMLPPYYTAGRVERAVDAVARPLKRLFWRGMEGVISRKFHIAERMRPHVGLPEDLFYGGQILDDSNKRLTDFEGFAAMRGEINSFVRNGVILQDGSFLAADVVLYCTGYEKTYDYFDGEVRSRLGLQKDGLYLYRNCLPCGVPHLAFVGSEVSTYSNILTHGLQALWLAHVLTGRVQLPPPAEMAADVRLQQHWRRKVMPPQRSRGAVLMLYGMHYHDQLLRDMGAPPRRKGLNLFAECFGAYSAGDYRELLQRDGAAASAALTAPAAAPAPAVAAAGGTPKPAAAAPTAAAVRHALVAEAHVDAGGTAGLAAMRRSHYVGAPAADAAAAVTRAASCIADPARAASLGPQDAAASGKSVSAYAKYGGRLPASRSYDALPSADAPARRARAAGVRRSFSEGRSRFAALLSAPREQRAGAAASGDAVGGPAGETAAAAGAARARRSRTRSGSSRFRPAGLPPLMPASSSLASAPARLAPPPHQPGGAEAAGAASAAACAASAEAAALFAAAPQSPFTSSMAAGGNAGAEPPPCAPVAVAAPAVPSRTSVQCPGRRAGGAGNGGSGVPREARGAAQGGSAVGAAPWADAGCHEAASGSCSSGSSGGCTAVSATAGSSAPTQHTASLRALRPCASRVIFGGSGSSSAGAATGSSSARSGAAPALRRGPHESGHAAILAAAAARRGSSGADACSSAESCRTSRITTTSSSRNLQSSGLASTLMSTRPFSSSMAGSGEGEAGGGGCGGGGYLVLPDAGSDTDTVSFAAAHAGSPPRHSALARGALKAQLQAGQQPQQLLRVTVGAEGSACDALDGVAGGGGGVGGTADPCGAGGSGAGGGGAPHAAPRAPAPAPLRCNTETAPCPSAPVSADSGSSHATQAVSAPLTAHVKARRSASKRWFDTARAALSLAGRPSSKAGAAPFSLAASSAACSPSTSLSLWHAVPQALLARRATREFRSAGGESGHMRDASNGSSRAASLRFAPVRVDGSAAGPALWPPFLQDE